MKIEIDGLAIADLTKMDRAQLALFGKHIDKIANNPLGRHLNTG
jgi:hypothetical protein